MARTTVPNELVAVNAIQGTLIADNAITAVHIATNAVSGTLIADNAVTSTHIAQNNVTATQISQNTITVTQLADDAVETAKINASAVTTAKINNGAVTEDKLAANSVTSAKIVNGTIVAADLADDAVTIAKMAALARGKIIYGDSSGAPAALALGSNGQVLKSDGTDIAWATLSTGVDGISSSADATAITIDSSERVGIGVASPSAKLQVDGEVRVQSSTEDGTSLFSIYNENTNPDSEQFFIAMNGSSVEMGNARSNALDFFTSDTRRMRITSGGYVGVGTTSPQGELHLVGASGAPVRLYLSDVDDGTGAADSLLITKSGATAYIYNRDDGDLRLGTNDDNDMLTIDTTGKIGIGTTSPNLKLHVEESADDTWIADFKHTHANAYGLRVDLSGTTSSTRYALGVYTGGGTGMFVRNNGTVGIGTNSPSGKLHVGGHTSSVASIFESSGNGDTVPVQLKVKANNGTTSTQGIYGNAGSASTDNTITLGTDGTTGLTVNNGGKVGIGTTSPLSHLTFESDHWNTGTEDGPSIRWNNGITTADSVLQNFEDANVAPFVLGMNSFVSSGGSFTTFNNSYAASYLYLGASGAIMMGTSSSGTATERMQIKPSGEVVIGTQTAVSNAKLTVDGGDMMVQGANNSCGISDLLPGYTRGDYGVIYSTANHVYFKVGSSYVSYINGGDGTFNVSDQRIKENVSTLTGTLDKVKQLRGVSFTWKDTEERGTDTKIGLIAQEVEAVYPQLVDDGGLPKDNEGNDPLKSVNYAHLTSVLIEALKELDTKLTAAEARIKTLEDA